MTNILVIGDSHSKIFKHYNGSEFNFTVKEVLGATARGSINPNTKTNSLNIFRKSIEEYSNHNKIFIVLGEVDCGYLIWYKNKFEGLSIDGQMMDTIDKISNFLSDYVFSKFIPENVFLLGSTPPVIEDNTNKNFLRGERSKITTTLDERLKLTLNFNSELFKLSTKLKCNYIDINHHVIDTNTNRVYKKWRFDNPYNHHLNNDTLSLWIDEFKKIQL